VFLPKAIISFFELLFKKQAVFGGAGNNIYFWKGLGLGFPKIDIVACLAEHVEGKGDRGASSSF